MGEGSLWRPESGSEGESRWGEVVGLTPPSPGWPDGWAPTAGSSAVTSSAPRAVEKDEINVPLGFLKTARLSQAERGSQLDG